MKNAWLPLPVLKTIITIVHSNGKIDLSVMRLTKFHRILEGTALELLLKHG